MELTTTEPVAPTTAAWSAMLATEPSVIAWFHRGEEIVGDPAATSYREGCAVVVCTYKRAQSLRRFLDSLRVQEYRPDQLVIVDASPDDATERQMQAEASVGELACSLLYVRVTGPLRGLTRQRNFGARFVATDLLAFFDDDIVLLPGCLREMVAAHRQFGPEVAGVSAYLRTEWPLPRAYTAMWRVRRALGMVGSLRPGSYHHSGMSISWAFLPPTDEIVSGDWLPGGATMWKSAVVREVGYHEAFAGYAQGEDLDFSLRAAQKGLLLVAGAARLKHLHEPSSRPNYVRMGYMAVHNSFEIHRRVIPDRNWRDIAWFTYAWSMETLLLARHLAFPRRWPSTFRQIAGRARAALDLMAGL